MQPDKNLQKEISQDLTTIDTESTREVILSWLESGGEAFELTEFQQKILLRLEYADEMIRRNLGKKNREEIANLIMGRWNVSRATAYKDIIDAEFVFSSSTPLNKKYMVGLQIEALNTDIRNARIANDYKAIAMLQRSLQKYIEMYPDEQHEKSPSTFIYNFDVTKIFDKKPTVEDAEFIIDEALKLLPNASN
jgi:hypothetical protein